MVYVCVSVACVVLSLYVVCSEPDIVPGEGRTPFRYTIAECLCIVNALLYFLLSVLDSVGA